MNRALLPQLREIKIKDAKSAILSIRFALEVFGHTAIEIQICEDYKIDMQSEALERGWHVEKHTLCYGIRIDKNGEGSYKEIHFVPRGNKRQTTNDQADSYSYSED